MARTEGKGPTKTCPACKRRLPADAFPATQELGYVSDGMGDGRHDECRGCRKRRGRTAWSTR